MKPFYKKSRVEPSGQVSLSVVRANQPLGQMPHRELTLSDIIRFGFPFGHRGLSDDLNRWKLRNLKNLMRGLNPILRGRMVGLAPSVGSLFLVRIAGGSGRLTDYGLVSLRVVTDAGVAFVVDAFQNILEPEIMKYHGLGTGTTNEAAGDTALVTELTTEYTGNVRATGSLTEGATGNIFRTVGTNTLDSGTPAVTEHGVFSQAATGGGTLLDRSKFSAINLNGANGDGLQSTYDLTLTSGS